LWRQILADVLRAEIVTVPAQEGAAYGAALLAATGAGWFPSVEDAAAAVVETVPAARPSDRVELYAGAHERYDGLYPALSPTFDALSVGGES
ncbi:MAG: xylulokinase, partial [Acidimicrobiia bacterium]